ncbi:MAG: EAL domain-containing protein, partial [Okeania sp. SIO2D1]|nr:EAL domain-containing protein [Okeania sp. SIO2D1]
PLEKVPVLFYKTINQQQLFRTAQQLQKRFSPLEQAQSRFLLISSSLDITKILAEFLQSQPLSELTKAVRNAWFFPLIFEQNFVFHYQPIFRLKTGRVVAHECLVRAHDQQGNFFGAQQLIDAALETNIINEFDELIRNICLQSLSKLNSDTTFFINIVPNAILNNPIFPENIATQVEKLGLQPQKIVFELTEIAKIACSSQMQQIVSRLRQKGFLIAIDDLCSYTNFESYFLDFCPDIIKIDKQLVRGCSEHGMKQILLKSILESAHELGCCVVAEGLEKQKDINFCRNIGIDMGQGYGLGTPQLTLHKSPVDLGIKQLQVAS